jgi:tRNA-specific 2-thiouridylase
MLSINDMADNKVNKRVVVGLSGGVDSSVAAYLLKEQGYEVLGLFMKNWHDDSVTISKECPWLEDSNDAMLVAQKLGIPFQTVDLSAQYKERIVDYMFREYEMGRTPNPDVLCNREIKFDVFLEIAQGLGADFVATGHYCQKKTTEISQKEVHHLMAGADDHKDQSYFLCQLTQNQLAKALFPIGHLKKAEVRAIAKTQGLITAEKRDSQGLCFIGKVRLPEFLQQQLKATKGDIIEIPKDAPCYGKTPDHEATVDQWHEYWRRPMEYQPTDGAVVGTHQGAHFFTIGQRKGLSVGGKQEPLFILATDVSRNIIYVGQGKAHPGLHRRGLRVTPSEVHWIRTDLKLPIGGSMEVKARIRYRQPLESARLFQKDSGLYVIFEKEQTAISSGQFVAWYQDNALLGSGVIE